VARLRLFNIPSILLITWTGWWHQTSMA